MSHKYYRETVTQYHTHTLIFKLEVHEMSTERLNQHALLCYATPKQNSPKQ